MQQLYLFILFDLYIHIYLFVYWFVFVCLFAYLFLQNDSLVRHWYEKADMQQRKKLRTDYYAVLRVSPIASEVFFFCLAVSLSSYAIVLRLYNCLGGFCLENKRFFGGSDLFSAFLWQVEIKGAYRARALECHPDKVCVCVCVCV
jgi:hypothetical protein